MFKALPLFYYGVWEIPKRDGEAEKPPLFDEEPEVGLEPTLNLRLLEKAGLLTPEDAPPLDLMFLYIS